MWRVCGVRWGVIGISVRVGKCRIGGEVGATMLGVGEVNRRGVREARGNRLVSRQGSTETLRRTWGGDGGIVV